MEVYIYIYCKTLSNSIRIQKSASKNQKLRKHYFITGGDHRKTIKVIKVLNVKCAPFTGIAEGIGMAHGNGCLLVSHGHH